MTENPVLLVQAVYQTDAVIAPASAHSSTDWKQARAQLRLLLGAAADRVVDLPFGRMRIPQSPRTHTPFKDVVPVSGDAPVYDRLAGWMGRDPAW